MLSVSMIRQNGETQSSNFDGNKCVGLCEEKERKATVIKKENEEPKEKR